VKSAPKPIMGSADDDGIMLIGCIRTPHTVRTYPVSFRDVHADAQFGMRMLERMGVTAASMVVVTSGSSELAHFWPYQVAVAQLQGCVAIAENFIFDAARPEMFMRRLPIKLAFGITDAILDGMALLNLDIAKAFAPAGGICARDGAANRLKEFGFSPWQMVAMGPIFAFVSPEGETFYDTDEWLLEEGKGELLVTARNARSLPLVRFRTGVAGSIDGDGKLALA